jgi:hypothetical protein
MSGTKEKIIAESPDAARSKGAGRLRHMASRAIALAGKLYWPEGWQQLFGTPLGWAFLCCLAGVGVGFAPWVRVELNALPAGLMGLNFTINGSGGLQNGFSMWNGVSVTIIFAMLGVLLYLVGRHESRPRWLPAPLLLAGLAILVITGLLLWDLEHQQQPVMNRQVTTTGNLADGLMQPFQSLMNTMLQQMQQMVKITPSAGPYLAGALGAALIVLAGLSSFLTRASGK